MSKNKQRAREAEELEGRQKRVRTVAVWALVLAVLSLGNILAMAHFVSPTYDDYIYSGPLHYALEAGGGFWSGLEAIGETVAYTYEDWQGTFGSVVLFALQPGVWGEEFYGLTVWVMVGAVIGSVWLAVHCIRKMDRWGELLLTVVLSFFCVQYLPEPSQWLYWWNGAAHYLLCWLLGVLVVTWQIRLTRREKADWKFYAGAVGCCALSFFVGGGNYCTALVLPLLSGTLTVLAWLDKRPQPVFRVNWLVTVCALEGLLFSVVAPGNGVRQGTREVMAPWTAIWRSFCHAAADLGELLLDGRTLGALMLCVPLFLYATRESEYRFRKPLLILAGSFCALAALYTPPIYAIGEKALVGRLTDLTWLAGVFFTFGNAFYLAGWANRKWEWTGRMMLRRRLEALAALGLAVFCAAVLVSVEDTNSWKAREDLRAPELAQYRAERDQRRATAADLEALPRFQRMEARPRNIYYSDLATWAPDVLVDGEAVGLKVYRGRGGFSNYVELEEALAFFEAEGELEPGDFTICFPVRGRHYVPIREFCDGLGLEVSYSGKLDTMYITTGG